MQSNRHILLSLVEYATKSTVRRWSELRIRPPLVATRSLHHYELTQPSTADQFAGLPFSCSGCGAYAQVEDAEAAGYYSLGRKTVRAYIEQFKGLHGRDALVKRRESPQSLDDTATPQNSNDRESSPAGALISLPSKDGPQNVPSLICDRCHKLLHHANGVPIAHPAIASIQDIISESPYRNNHIYHVVDAADFPMSLIPDLQRRLTLNPQRSKNRRANPHTFRRGRLMEMSFIITRADLLAPTKELVDRLMPYITRVLRDALGHAADGYRLGNVHLVSAHRGWWTREIKEKIWFRGGCGWLVGKANVGKSHLLQCIFPKGQPRSTEPTNLTIRDFDSTSHLHSQPDATSPPQSEHANSWTEIARAEEELASRRLLPPKPYEVEFPAMPIVSSLPGTTAAPIRLPFGHGKGELVDLPGLDRNGFEAYLTDQQKHQMIMNTRPKPGQISVKPGQALLIGNIARIRPYHSDAVFLAYPFIPAILPVISASGSHSINTSSTEPKSEELAASQVPLVSAGIYELRWDVTRQRAGHFTRNNSLGLQAERLPFIIFSMDVVLEGIGWIEMAVQVRRKVFQELQASACTSVYPRIEIFSPHGRHVMVREPMNASLMLQRRSGKPNRLDKINGSIRIAKDIGRLTDS